MNIISRASYGRYPFFGAQHSTLRFFATLTQAITIEHYSSASELMTSNIRGIKMCTHIFLLAIASSNSWIWGNFCPPCSLLRTACLYTWGLRYIRDSTNSKHHQLSKNTARKYYFYVSWTSKWKSTGHTAPLITKSALCTHISSPCHSTVSFLDKNVYLCPSKGRLIKSCRKM